MSAELTPLQRAFLALEETRAKLAASEARQREPIAIVGMGCRFPGSADSPSAYWSLLHEGRSAITTVPTARWDHAPYFDASSTRTGTTYAQHAGFIKAPVEAFDAAFFGISPREAAAMDPQQRLLLEVAWEALEHAGIAPDRLAGSATGVFVGMPSGDYLQLQLRGGTLADIDAHYASGIAHSIAAGRLSYLLGLQGPSLAIDTACSSSLVAVHLACQSLRNRETDLSLAAGVNLILSPESFLAFGRTHMLAADGRCKAFDDSADGFVRGEGCGVVVLKRLSDALADGDRVLAVIRGSAANQDGASASLTAPSGPAQESVIRKALTQAALSPADVQFVEAHGTGTALGDPIELRALGAVYGARRTAEQALIVGSVKANVGHLEGAAGVASLIKAVLALNASHVPGQLHIERPTSHVDWDALHLRLPAAGGESWPAAPVRRAAVSAFGFSGTNAHVIVEQAPEAARVSDAASAVVPLVALRIIPIAARTPDAVRALAAAYAEQITDLDSLADVAYTVATGRAQLIGARSAMVSADPVSARRALHDISSGEKITTQLPGLMPRAAFLFTGQGSQSPGMGRELYESHPGFRASIDASAVTLAVEWHGVALRDVLYGPDSEELLREPRFVQPALVAIELALAALWRSWGVEPVLVAGHSLGEYTAAAVAGVMSADDALRLVAARGRLMSELPPSASAMTSIPANLSAVAAALGALLGTRVELAADNGASQCVLTGSTDDVAHAEQVLRDALGVEPRRLVATTNAFHSRFIEPMLDAFEAAAGSITFNAPRVPVIWNLGAAALAPHQAPTARYWRNQTRQAVQFGEIIQALRDRGVTHAIEIGPHPVLTALVAAVDDRALPRGIASLRRGRGDWETITAGVAQWWQDGGKVDWTHFNSTARRQPIALPTYPFAREPHWLPFARVGAAPRAMVAGHALVGTQVSSPAFDAVVFEALLSARAEPLLDQHRIHGRATLPGAAWLDAMAVAGSRTAPNTRWSVRGLTLHAPLQLDDDQPRVVQLLLRSGSDAQVQTIAAYSRDAADAAAAWTLHADATLEPLTFDETVRTIAWPEEASAMPAEMYERFARVGLSLGAEFHRVRSAARFDHRAVATIDASMLPAWADGIVHPVLIDACIQVIALAVPPDSSGQDALFMPLAVEQFDWRGSVSATFVCEARLRPIAGHGETLVADVVACDTERRVIGELRGVTLKRATPDALRRVQSAAVRDALYEVQWEKKVLPAGGATQSLEAMVASVVAQGPARAAATSLTRYSVDGPAIDRLAALYVWRALEKLGADLSLGTVLTVAALADALRVQSRHRQLLGRLLDILVEDEVLARTGSGYVVQRPLHSAAIPESLQALRASNTPFSGELDLMVRCGESLAPALTGDTDPLTLLFPNGSLDEVHRIYRDSPFPRTYNALVRDAIAALVAARGTSAPLRILEVGGGTGGTTAAVLHAIPDGGCEYLFTDTSPLFLTRARERFSARSDMAYRVFDLEQDAGAQGFAAESFDLVMGANVIHATRDVAATLGRLQELLVPGGAVLMLEMARPSRWVDLSFGFTDGWWAFADDFRQDYPLLPSDGWQRVLESVGFSDVRIALGTAGSGVGLEEQSMILARKPQRNTRSKRWVVLHDGHGIGREISDRLGGRGDDVVLVDNVDKVPTSDRHALSHTLSVIARAGTVTGVIDARTLHVGEATDGNVPALAAQAATAALDVAQAVLTYAISDGSARPRLCYVTQCAVRTDAADLAPSLPQSTVWGFARSLQLEHPELATSCIDLPLTPTDAQLDALVDEFCASAGEPQVALRHGSRLIARVDQAAATTPAYPQVYRVAPRSRGAIESLEVSAAVLPVAGADEIIIRVAATGMNFKDVLNVLGTYPGDPGDVGGECAGYVLSVGANVSTHRRGDRVVAIAPAAMGSHVVTHAALAARVPDAMSLDAAAALPIAYLTAYHTLIELAKLQPGERVLIHAGAGGVGMAAIRIAQRAGAEIFATAGSEAKRAYLRSIGVPHVLDSRNLAFAEEVLSLTHGTGVDVTLNSLSDAFVERSLAVTARGGRFLEIGKRGIWSDAQVKALGTELQYHIVDWTDRARTDPVGIGALLQTVMHDVATGALPPLPVDVFPLSQVHDAFRFMAQGRHLGKLVISHREALDADGARPVQIVPDASYVIVGGTSGIGLLTADWLGSRGATHLALCSRSGGDAITRQAVARLAASGVRVSLFAVDVADADAVRDMLQEVRSVAPIRGVMQSAGLLDDGAVLQLDAARMSRVFGPKVTGTWNLHQLTLGDPLDFFVGYASVAGFLGSAGQANHAAANAFMDALSQYRRAEGRPAVSIDWGAWDEVGAAVRYGVLARAAGVGVRSITPADGLAMLSQIFAGSSAQVAAVPIDWSTFLASRTAPPPPFFERMARRVASKSPTRTAAAAAPVARDAVTIVSQLADAVAARRPALLRTFLRARVARTLGLPDGQTVDDRQPLRDAGLDSLLAIELRNVLGSALSRSLPATLLFDYPTVDDLATHLLTLLFPETPTAVPTADVVRAPDAAVSLMSELSELSDEEVDRLLAAKRKGRA